MGWTQCLQCGMKVDEGQHHCPKCDNDLRSQTDGSTLTIDIAHHGEKITDALRKLDASLAGRGLAAKVRIVVGSGLIREAVLVRLATYEHRGEIRRFGLEDRNPGAIIVGF